MDWEKVDLSLDDIIMKKAAGKRGDQRNQRRGKENKKSGRMGRAPASRMGVKPAVAKKILGPKTGGIAKKPVRMGQASKRMIGKAQQVQPRTKFSITNEKAKSAGVTERKAKEVAGKGGIVFTVRNDRAEKGPTAEDSRDRRRERPRFRSVSPPPRGKKSRDLSRRHPEPVERLEINITNDIALNNSNNGQEEMIPAQAPMISPALSHISQAGLASTSSHFRTPMAVMDLYTGRYARPSLEPYRPPPVVQQFYKSLAESTALGHIPAQYTQHVPIMQHQQQHQQQYSNQAPSSTIRKPYDV